MTFGRPPSRGHRQAAATPFPPPARHPPASRRLQCEEERRSWHRRAIVARGMFEPFRRGGGDFKVSGARADRRRPPQKNAEPKKYLRMREAAGGVGGGLRC